MPDNNIFIASSEKGAIKKAIKALNLQSEQFDVEILDRSVPLFLGRKGVKIKVLLPRNKSKNSSRGTKKRSSLSDKISKKPTMDSSIDMVDNIVAFTSQVILLMSCEGTVSFKSKVRNTIHLEIQTPMPALIIGRKGKNIDALHNIVNAYASNNAKENPPRVMIDLGDYRDKKNINLKRLALDSYEQVMDEKGSLTLDLMLPEERKVIHQILNEKSNVTTESEGQGLYKKVVVSYKK